MFFQSESGSVVLPGDTCSSECMTLPARCGTVCSCHSVLASGLCCLCALSLYLPSCGWRWNSGVTAMPKW